MGNCCFSLDKDTISKNTSEFEISNEQKMTQNPDKCIHSVNDPHQRVNFQLLSTDNKTVKYKPEENISKSQIPAKRMSMQQSNAFKLPPNDDFEMYPSEQTVNRLPGPDASRRKSRFANESETPIKMLKFASTESNNQKSSSSSFESSKENVHNFPSKSLNKDPREKYGAKENSPIESPDPSGPSK